MKNWQSTVENEGDRSKITTMRVVIETFDMSEKPNHADSCRKTNQGMSCQLL